MRRPMLYEGLFVNRPSNDRNINYQVKELNKDQLNERLLLIF